MLFDQRRFQLRADGLNAFYLVKVIKIRTVVAGEVGKQKLSVCESGCILPLPESGFVIVAANDDGLVRQSFFHGLGYSREIVCGKGHINRPACGKVDTCARSKPLTNGNRLFRLPLNDELPSRYLAAHKKTFCSIGIDALQTLQIVCGYGDYEALEREAKEMGCKNVVCTGPTSDVPGVMKDAAIFAFSSRFEGFGLVLTEANACSVPAVSYNCPVGPSEIVTDGVDGFLVEPENVTQFAEKLMELMKDDKLRAEMGVKAYESSKRFAMDKILKEWVELIEE